VLGIAFNYALHGLAYYADAAPLMGRLAALGMLVQVQIEKDQMAALAPMLRASGARLMIDHCGRPDVSAGLAGAGFAAVLSLADTGRAWIKLSGFSKFSTHEFPFADAFPFVEALLAAYGPDHCLWASDWPFLKAPSRHDYGSLLQLFAQCVPDPAVRQAILWDTPRRLFNFGTD
jgi:predicted TIM-barrel fold metal-dependent hydrolase